MLKEENLAYYINSPQVQRILKNLYEMTAEEVVTRLEAPPEINTQIGPSFKSWLGKKFPKASVNEIMECSDRICILDATEEVAKKFVEEQLKQKVEKRPDLVAKAGKQFVIGEAKWIGQPGGNQTKQVREVLEFCKQQRGEVRRIGIIDGFPWALRKKDGSIVSNKEAVLVQESPYDILSALLLEEYLSQFLL